MNGARRSFNFGERMALFRAAGGRCTDCGAELTRENFHADHITPFARGGATDVINGQALCAVCNRKKGAKAMEERKWQIRCLEEIALCPDTRFLIEACPAAGKTKVMLETMRRRFASGVSRKAIIAAPTTEVVHQVALAARGMGIELDYGDNSDIFPLRADCRGYVTTYQSIASQPLDHRRFASGNDVFAACDEIHHASINKPWGQGINSVLEHSGFILSMSGTPFRHDEENISFLHYGTDGIPIPNFKYTYSEAVSDEICRRIVFAQFDGDIEWAQDGLIFKKRFGDLLSKQDEGRRLRTAIDHKYHLFHNMLGGAINQLDEIRKTHPDAGGLVLCEGMEPAKAIAAVLEAMTGEAPTIAISEDKNAPEKIRQFRDSPRKWIVAVRMISEGVDIPRLRVGVWGTNYRTDLFFRQAIGRFIRMQADVPGFPIQPAYLFIPADPEIVRMAKQIEQDIAIAVDEVDKREERKAAERNEAEPWRKLAADGMEQGRIASGEDYSAEEIKRAQRAKARWPFLDETDLININREMDRPIEADTAQTSREEIDAISSRVNKLVARIAVRLNGQMPPKGGDAYKQIHNDLKRRMAVVNFGNPTLAEWQRIEEEGKRWLASL
jgi:superfamily II DNA or RNA helicase